jgi:hypothetical protein
LAHHCLTFIFKGELKNIVLEEESGKITFVEMLGFTKVSQSLVGRTIFQIIKTTVAIDPVRLEVGNGLEPRLFESAGIKQTSSARERNMLNILSYNCSPLRTSRVVIDKSQSIKPLV